MTVIVTRDVEGRFRGFLASVMLEIAPGVYTSSNMSKGVRDRVCEVLNDWWHFHNNGSIVATWKDSTQPSGLGLFILGCPPKEIVSADGVLLSKNVDYKDL